MPTQIAQAEGIHPYWLGSDTPIGVDEAGTKWSISYKGRNAVLLATFAGGVTLEFKIPTDAVNKSGSVAAFTIPNFGNAQWVTHREHVKFEVRFPTPPKVTEVSVNIARQGCTIVSDGNGGLDVLAGSTKVGALPRPWIDYTPDGSQDRTRLWLDWVVAEPTMKLVMPTLSATEWATAVLDPTVITTSTASTATAYSNQRKIDRTQNGVLWAMYWDGTSNTTSSMHFRYSTDNGATWSDGGGFGFAGTGTTYVPKGSLFIGADDYAHVVYKDRSSSSSYYRRGTPNVSRTAYSWSAATELWTSSFWDFADIVAHPEGSGWRAHVVASYNDGGSSSASYWPLTITSGGAVTVGGRVDLAAFQSPAVHTYPSIDFNHTGDGKTVAGGTPHLYVAWSAGATGAGKGIRFKKATYSGGSWTWGTEREIDSTRYVPASPDGRYWIASVFDGSRVVIGGSFDSFNIALMQRDAADTTTTTLATQSGTAGTDRLVSGSLTYDANGNAYIFGREGASPGALRYRRFNRAATTLEAAVNLATISAFPLVSAKRGYSGNRIEFVYMDGTASPYSVTYDSILLTEPPNTGTATGSITNTGSATGTRASRGTASGSVTNDGSATGAAPVIPPNTGTASGSITITGSARGGTGATAVGTITITGSATGFAPEVFYSFTPPIRYVGSNTNEKPFKFFQQAISMNVVQRNGRFQEVRVAADQEEHLVEGESWFSGGRTYRVNEDTRLLLEADGFTVDIT